MFFAMREKRLAALFCFTCLALAASTSCPPGASTCPGAAGAQQTSFPEDASVLLMSQTQVLTGKLALDVEEQAVDVQSEIAKEMNKDVPSYRETANGKSACPSGSQPIANEQACKSAKAALGLHWKQSGSWGNIQPGCFSQNPGKRVWWNKNTAGTDHKDFSSICIVVEAPTPAPTPAPTSGKAPSTSTIKPKPCDRSEAAFKEADVNHDGVISLPEWTGVTKSMCDGGLVGTPIRFDPHTASGPNVTATPHYFFDSSLEFEKIASQTMPSLFDETARKTYLMNEDDPMAKAYMRIGKLDKTDPALLKNGKYHFKIIYDCKYVLEWEQSSWLDAIDIQGFTCLVAPRRSGHGNKLFEGSAGDGMPDCNGRSAAQSGHLWNGLRTVPSCPKMNSDNLGCMVLDTEGGWSVGTVGVIKTPWFGNGNKMLSYAGGESGATSMELWVARKK